MVNYEDGLQYKIVCKNLEILDIYIGSTCNFNNRKRDHKVSCNNPLSRIYHLKVYQFIRANGGWDNWDMILIEYSPCKTKQELLARERYFYETLKPTLNSVSPTLDIEKERITTKKYDDAHKEKRQIYRDGRKDLKKIVDKKYAETHKAERKIYEDEHRAEINAKQNARRLANLEEFNAKRRAKYALKKSL